MSMARRLSALLGNFGGRLLLGLTPGAMMICLQSGVAMGAIESSWTGGGFAPGPGAVLAAAAAHSCAGAEEIPAISFGLCTGMPGAGARTQRH